MTRFRTILRSFAGGELSPDLLGRMHDVRYQTGMRTARNFLPSPRGPAVKRRGLSRVTRSPADARMMLVPFRFSGDQNLVIGVGAGFCRFFSQGAPLAFVPARQVAEVDTTADTLRFLDPHGFTAGEAVRVFSCDGTEPAPLSDATTYTVVIVDAWTIQLTGIDLTTVGTGTIRVAPAAQMPRTYVASRNITGLDITTDRLTFAAAHLLVSGDPIVFTTTYAGLPWPLQPGILYYAIYVNATTIKVATTQANALAGTAINITGDVVTFDHVTDYVQWVAHGLVDNQLVTFGGAGLPPELTAGTVYWVVNALPGSFQVEATLGGGPINFTAGTGTAARMDARMHRGYEVADQVYLPTAGKGFYQCTQRDPRDNPPPAATTYWFRLPDDGALATPNTFTSGQLFEIDYDQTGDVVTFTHNDIDPQNLTRLSATQWIFGPAALAPPLPAPTGVTGTPDYGQSWAIDGFQIGTPGVLEVFTDPGWALGDIIYIEGSEVAALNNRYLMVKATGTVTDWQLRDPSNGKDITLAGGPYTADLGTARLAPLGADNQNSYVVTAVDAAGVESVASAPPVTITNNIYVTGAKNALSWSAVTGAVRYRVYRLTHGLYGLLGESTTTTYTDEGDVAPTLSESPPEVDTSMATSRPAAVANHDQRRGYGGFVEDPPRFVLSRTGDDADFSRHFPLQDDDRISLRATIDASRIRHMISLRNTLLLLSTSAELAAVAYGDNALTPENTGVVTLSRIGTGTPQPVALGAGAFFVAGGGQHVYEVVPDRSDGPTADASVRANHLFDGQTIVQLAAATDPWPAVYAVRADGVLLSLSHMPAEDVLGWGRIETQGAVESVCCVRDGARGAVYVMVNRAGVRSVQRMLEDVYLDDLVTWDGRIGGTITMQLDEGISWGVADELLVTGSATAPLEVGDLLVFYLLTYSPEGAEVWTSHSVTITQALTGTTWRGRPAATIPVALRSVAHANWALGKRRLRTPHASMPLRVVADGVDFGSVTSDANGFVAISSPALMITAGLPYTADLEPLPLALPQEMAGGKGLTWHLEAVYVSVAGGPFLVGPDADHLVPVLPGGRERVQLPGKWTEDGSLLLRSESPHQCEVRYLGLEVTAS